MLYIFQRQSEIPSSDVKMACDPILNNLRMSGLNFLIQETPFSLYVTIRKSKIRSPQVPLPSSAKQDLDSNIAQLKSRINFLEDANDRLKHDFQGAVDELEEKTKKVTGLEDDKKNLERQLGEALSNIETISTSKIENISEEKRSLQIKHEKMCAENKTLRNELDSVKKDLNSANIAVRTAKKENKEITHKFDKQLEKMDSKIRDLEEHKRVKISEEKEIRVKMKKAEKKLKTLREREANLELERTRFEKDKVDKDKENNVSLKCSCNNSSTLITEVAISDTPIFSSLRMDSTTIAMLPLNSSSSDTSNPSSLATPSFTPSPQDCHIQETSIQSLSSSLCQSILDNTGSAYSNLDPSDTDNLIFDSYILELFSLDPYNWDLPCPMVTTFHDDAATEIEHLVMKAEERFRDKARKLVKNKVAAKFEDFDLSEKTVSNLEVELLEDLEESIQEELKAYRDTLRA